MWLDFSKKIDLKILRKNYKEDWQEAIFLFLENWYDQNLEIKINTSGTTSKSKKLNVLKKQMIASAKLSNKFFALEKELKVLLCLSADFIATKMLLVRAILLQAKVYCLKPSSEPLKDLFVSYDKNSKGSLAAFDFASMVPLQAANSLDKLGHIKILLLGGAPLSKELEKKLQNISSKCYLSYGMTETLSHIALRKISGKDKSSCFKTLPEVKISKDKRSCLKIFHPEILDKPIQTNDLVEIISDSEFRWLGRYDYVINSGGIKMIPEIWEEKLSFFIKPRFFISSLPDKNLGEKIILVLQSKPFKLILNQSLFEGKNKFYKPKKVFFIEKFIETTSGKIKRKETLQKINLTKGHEVNFTSL